MNSRLRYRRVPAVDFRSSYDVEYTTLIGDPFLVIDNYGGFHKFGFLRGKTTCQDQINTIGIAWSLTLDE